MRKFFVTAVLSLFIFLAGASGAMAATDVGIVINGQAITFPDQKPYIDTANRTMVPVRAPMEAIGCIVDWDADKQQAILTKDGVVAVFTIGSSIYTVNGTPKTMDTRAVIAGNRTAFPIRFAAEAMGATVGWDAETYTVIISTQVTIPESPQVVSIAPSDLPGKEISINVAGYELLITNSCGNGADWLYIWSNKDIRVVAENKNWNQYIAPRWDGGTGIIKLDRWAKRYDLPGLIAPAPKAGDQIVLHVFGRVNGEDVKLVTVVKTV